jgi:hypothetical protein
LISQLGVFFGSSPGVSVMKNWRMALGSLGLLLITNTACADWKGNWLLGVSSDYADRRGELDVSLFYTGRPVVSVTNTNQRYSDQGLNWGLLAGYQIKCQGWTWGGEVHIDWHDIGTEQAFVFPDLNGVASWSVITRYKSDPIVALSGRMAYEMAPYFIAFLRLGVATTKDKLNVNIGGDPLVLPFNTQLQDSRWVYRYLVGVGTETPLFCTPLTLRMEYNYYSRGRSLSASAFNSAPTLLPFFTVDMHPRTNALKLSLVWNFS